MVLSSSTFWSFIPFKSRTRPFTTLTTSYDVSCTSPYDTTSFRIPFKIHAQSNAYLESLCVLKVRSKHQPEPIPAEVQSCAAHVMHRPNPTIFVLYHPSRLLSFTRVSCLALLPRDLPGPFFFE